LLIGADHYGDVVEDHIVRGKGPTAMQSKLGYLLSGPITVSDTGDVAASVLHVATQYTPDNALERFWNIKTLGITQQEDNPTKSIFDQYINKSISCEPNGSCTACFPWKEDHSPLPSNYSTCSRRLRSLLHKLKTAPPCLLHTQKFRTVWIH